MAANLTKPKGSKPDKIMRDAILLALHEEATDSNGLMTTKARLLGRKLVDKALDGDVPAIKEVNDRCDGKVPQAVIGGNEDDPPIKADITTRRIIVESGHSDSAGVPAAVEPGEI